MSVFGDFMVSEATKKDEKIASLQRIIDQQNEERVKINEENRRNYEDLLYQKSQILAKIAELCDKYEGDMVLDGKARLIEELRSIAE